MDSKKVINQVAISLLIAVLGYSATAYTDNKTAPLKLDIAVNKESIKGIHEKLDLIINHVIEGKK